MVFLSEDTIVAKIKKKKTKQKKQAGTRQATEFWCFSVLKGSYTLTVAAIQAALHSADRYGPKGVILVSTGIFSFQLPTAV